MAGRGKISAVAERIAGRGRVSVVAEKILGRERASVIAERNDGRRIVSIMAVDEESGVTLFKTVSLDGYIYSVESEMR